MISTSYAIESGRGQRCCAIPALTTELHGVAPMADASLLRWSARIKDISGQRFGRLTALSPARENGQIYWICRCVCGEKSRVTASHLLSGTVRSCGCLQRDVTSRRVTSHGHTCDGKRSPEYQAWVDMKKICLYPRNSSYRSYGAKGITVCQEWIESFEKFFACVGPRPTTKHSLDRINTKIGYEPGNVKWSSRKEQNRNKSNNKVIEAFGRSALLVEWSEMTGMDDQVISRRIRSGMPVEEALTRPVRRRCKSLAKTGSSP